MNKLLWKHWILTFIWNTWFLKNQIAPDKMVHYKINYCFRQRVADGSYRLFLIQTITLSTTEEGALLKVFGSQTDINHITSTNNYKLSLIGLNGEPSFLEIDVFKESVFDDFVPFDYEAISPAFTKRELEVIKLLTIGMSANAISAELIAVCIRRGYI